MSDVPANHFRCEECDGVFEKAWSDEEAQQEREHNFGSWPEEQCAVVCSDCYTNLTGIAT